MSVVGEGRQPLSPDARRVVAAQALRAFVYGFGALLLGTTLKRRGLSSAEVGLVLGAVVAGTVGASLAVARWSDQFGRRRSYVALYAALAAAGAVFALTGKREPSAPSIAAATSSAESRSPGCGRSPAPTVRLTPETANRASMPSRASGRAK